jgi:hypothetical protein
MWLFVVRMMVPLGNKFCTAPSPMWIETAGRRENPTDKTK